MQAARPRLERSGRAREEESGPRTAHGRHAARSTEIVREDEQKLTRMSWMIVLGLGLATALVLWQVTSAKRRDRAAIEALEKAKADLVASLQGFDVELEEGAQQAVALAEEKKRTWEGKDIEAEVKRIRARALKTIEAGKARKDLVSGLDAIERGLENADALTVDGLAESRRRIDEAENQTSLLDEALTARLTQVQARTDRAYVKKLRDVAAETAKGGGEAARTALTQFARAEEETLAIGGEYHDSPDKEAYNELQAIYKDIIQQSDAIAMATFTPEVIGRMPWKDLLAADQTANWAISQAKGFKHQFTGGALELFGPDPDADEQGVASIGDREKFRDFVVEFEGTLSKGHIELCLRTPTRIDRAVEAYPLDAQRLTPGVPFRMTITFIGSQVTYTPENGQPQEKTVPWSQSRKGAIAFVVDEGAELKITKLRIRLLR